MKFTNVIFLLTILLGVVSPKVLAKGSDSDHGNLRRDLGKPNKGTDEGPNNGLSHVNIGYNISSIMAANECFDPNQWCETDLLDILTNALEDEGVGQDDFVLLLNGLQAYFCNGAILAYANATAFLRGEGEFSVTRSGNHGAAKEISLDVNMDTAALALAHVNVTESANETAQAQAYAYSTRGSTGASCGTRYATGSLRYWLCANAQGSVHSSASAVATATGHSSAVAGSLHSSDVQVFVDAANIKEFHATVSTTTSSFASTEAAASAQAHASAFSNALVDVSSSATVQERRYNSCAYRRRERRCYGCPFRCRCYYVWVCVGGYQWQTILSSSFSECVRQVQSQVQESFASAFAASLAMLSVKLTIPAYYKNENGNEDTFMFPDGVDEIPLEVTMKCNAVAA